MTATRLQRYYFETSAVNALESHLSWEAAVNTKAYQNLRGRGYFISPLVIFEVLTTKDAQRRERIIHFAQHLFEPILLPSPEELIVAFVEGGCSRMEPEYELISQGNTAKHWRLICEDTRRTLFYDAQAIQTVSAALRELGRLLFEFHSHKDFRLVQANSILGINLTVFGIVQRYRLATEQDLEDPSYRQHIGLIVLLIIAVFCAGLSPDPESIENFWRKHRIEKVNDRIHYVFENHAALVNHGPFHLIAAVVDVHTDRAFSRGMIFDCLHAVYAVYADQFLTADRHFVEMREKLVQFSSATGKIRHMDELRLNWIETSGPPPTKGWLDT